MFKRFLMEQEGETVVEYGLFASLLALGIVGVLTAIRS